MSQVQQVHVDALLRGATMHFCSGAAPIAAAAEVRMSGPIVVARQATAPPEQYVREVPDPPHPCKGER